MDLCESEQLAQTDELMHWWLKTRLFYLERAFARTLQEHPSDRPLDILEVGCGTGQNLRFLRTRSRFSDRVARVVGVDPALSSQQCEPDWLQASRGDRLIRSLSDLGSTDQFDLIIGMDVLEHLDDDSEALKTWTEMLRPGGRVFISVPAFGFLWSYHDEILGHRRRYNRNDLRKVLGRSGLRVEKLRYAFAHIFLPAFLIRVVLFRKKGSRETTDLRPTWGPLNAALSFVGRFEAMCGGFPWFGTSLISLCRKN